MKDWAAGTVDVVEVTDYLCSDDNSLSVETYKYPPAWLKAIIDEPVVNCIDHYIRCYGTKNPVSTIEVTFNENGSVIVYNDGPGIEIKYHKVASMYVPQLIYGVLHQGEHAVKGGESITGGTNGIGAKLGNCFSKIFVVETVSDGQLYIQQWTDNMNNVKEPLIKSLDTIAQYDKRPHTKLTMMPDYTGLFKYPAFTPDLHALFSRIIHTRLMFASAFVNYANSIRGNKCPIRIIFNRKQIVCSGMSQIAKMICRGDVPMHTTVAIPALPDGPFKHAWELTAIIDDNIPDKLRTVSNVNGMMVRQGAHFDYISAVLRDYIREAIAKEIKDAGVKLPRRYFDSNIILLINCHVPSARWKGQAKDILDVPDGIRKSMQMTVDKRFLQALTSSVRDIIMSSLMQKTPKRTKNDFIEKYEPAVMTKRSNWQKHAPNCHLLCTEGNSAESQVRIGITDILGTDFYGTLIMKGVIINARRESTMVTAGGVEYVKKLPKLEKNMFVNALNTIVGLNSKHKYDPSSATFKQEIRQLKYHNIVVCVDQDEDGMNILGLFLNMFDRFWPNLLKAGFVKWWQTPIVRAYPSCGGDVIDFYNDSDYMEWLMATDHSKYKIKYYKGLGSHSRDEIISMMKRFNSRLCTITTTTFTRNWFEVFYGKLSLLRKQELSKPFVPLSVDTKRSRIDDRKTSCDDILRHEVNESQRYNISRKLDNAVDGMNTCGRKIFEGCIRHFGEKNQQMKVSQLGGHISADMGYHHGEDSLEKSITGKAFIGIGGKQLPQLIPLSNFGTRGMGGADASASRYISTKFNKRLNNLIYPAEDYPNLTFTFTEGFRTEPVCYYPIIPTTCTESTHIPAHGWKLKTWARDAHDVIRNVRFMILNSDHSRLLPMRPDTYGWKGRIGHIDGIESSFGTYYYDSKKNMIVITELPLRVWTKKYVESELKPKLEGDIVSDFDNKSNDLRICIEVYLKPGAFELLETMGTPYCDGIEEHFKLRQKMTKALNYLGPNKEVLEFKSYDDLLRYWFPLRRDFYLKRIQRNILLMQLNILRMENEIKYKTSGLSMHGLSKAQQNELLLTSGYVKFTTTCVKLTSTDELREAVLGAGANYEYLLKMSDGKKSSESILKLQNKLENLREELSQYTILSNKGSFPGAQIWMDELDKLEIEIKIGRPTRWLYDELTKYKL